MKKEFISYLLTKPDKYLQVACYLYSKSDENGNVSFSYFETSLKFFISKQTLRRIVKDIREWNNNNCTIGEPLWNCNELTINILNIFNGIEVESKKNENSKEIKQKTIPIEAKQLIGYVTPKTIHPMQKYIKDECKNIQKIKEQLSHSQCDYLLVKFPKELIKNKLKALENKVGIERQYVSVFKTIEDWCTKDIEWQKEKTKEEIPKLTPKTYYTGYECE